MQLMRCTGCKRVRPCTFARKSPRYPEGRYCAACYETLEIDQDRNPNGISSIADQGPSPGQENAIRCLEDRETS